MTIPLGCLARVDLRDIWTSEASDCILSLEQGQQRVGDLLVHRPQIVSVTEQPVRDLTSREDYGPAD